MAFSKELDAAMADEEFQKSLENKTGEEVKAAYAERGIDIEKELDAGSVSESEELDESDLEGVAGGSLASDITRMVNSLGKVWNATGDACIILRAYYDLKRYGNATRSYSADRIYKAARRLGLE